MRVRRWWCPVAVLALLCAGATQVPRPEPVSDAESYAVYAAVASRPWLGPKVAAPPRLAVSERTAFNPECLPKGGPMETTWRPVVESFTRENATPRRILPGRGIGVPYDVLTRSQVQTHFTHAENIDDGWRQFRATLSGAGGLTTWSAVGFDAARRRALVYVNFSCGSLCAEGRYVFLEKQGAAWRTAELPDVKTCVIVS
mgnify:CR=1 FL=1